MTTPAAISLRVFGRNGLPLKGVKYDLLEQDGSTCFGVIRRGPDDDSSVLVHFSSNEDTLTVRASKDAWTETRTFGKGKVQFDFYSDMHPDPPAKVVIVVHGILTHAFWFGRLKGILEEEPGVRVHSAKYGRFGLFSFLIPGPWRRLPIERVKQKVRPIIVDANRLGHEVSVIAHSNGTQVTTRILREDPLFQIDNLIMCGSVVDEHYDWHLVKSRVRGRIVNDYGTRDVWPAIARSITWGYGYSGTVGFGMPVDDRLHNVGHSDYFTDDFIREFWLPLIGNNVFISPPRLPTDSAGRPWWFWFFELPLRWIFPVLVVTIAFHLLG